MDKRTNTTDNFERTGKCCTKAKRISTAKPVLCSEYMEVGGFRWPQTKGCTETERFTWKPRRAALYPRAREGNRG